MSKLEICQFIGVLIMAGIYPFPEQRFFMEGHYTCRICRFCYESRSIHAHQEVFAGCRQRHTTEAK